MALSHAERQRNYRARQKSPRVTRDVTASILLEILFEIRSLRDELRDSRDGNSLNKRFSEVRPPAPTPTSPELLPPSQSKENSPTGNKRKERVPATSGVRGTRLPLDWQPSEADLEYLHGHLPGLDIELEAEKFRNHFHAASGPNAVKRDWSKAFRNWCIKAAEQKGLSYVNGTDFPLDRPSKDADIESAYLAIKRQLGLAPK